MSLISFFNKDPLFSEFNRLFDDAFARRTGGHSGQVQCQGTANDVLRVLRPRIDVHEDKEQNLVTITLELPGMTKENVSVDVHHNLLTLSGETKFEYDRDEGGFLLREPCFDRFSPSVPVLESVNSKEIKASMENGVLTVIYPCQTPEQLPKKIAIS